MDESISKTPDQCDWLNRPVKDLGLSTRAYNCLAVRGVSVMRADRFFDEPVRTVGELVQISEAELLRSKNLGRVSLADIKAKLSAVGLFLGYRPDVKIMPINAGTEQLPEDSEQPVRLRVAMMLLNHADQLLSVAHAVQECAHDAMSAFRDIAPAELAPMFRKADEERAMELTPDEELLKRRRWQ